MKTKKMVYAKMQLLQEVSRQLKDLEEWILQGIHRDGSAVLGNAMKELRALEAGTRTLDEAFQNLESWSVFGDMEEGADVSLPSVEIRYGGEILVVRLATKDGNVIDATVCHADNPEEGTVQANISYTENKGKANELLIDLATVEIKKGKLAKSNKLPENNKDIDIYLWTDPFTEEFTNRFRMKHSDILEALKACEE